MTREELNERNKRKLSYSLQKLEVKDKDASIKFEEEYSTLNDKVNSQLRIIKNGQEN